MLFPTAAGSGTYKISADESDPIKSTGTATLSLTSIFSLRLRLLGPSSWPESLSEKTTHR